MKTMSIALVQMRCEKGAINANLAAIQAYVREAISRDVDIICFPEMSISGYIDPTHQPEAVLHLDGPAVARFVAMTSGTQITVLAGLVLGEGLAVGQILGCLAILTAVVSLQVLPGAAITDARPAGAPPGESTRAQPTPANPR